MKKATKGKLTNKPAPASDRNAIRRVLDENAQNTQDALDAYVAQVADPVLLEHLVLARNKARAAVAVFELAAAKST